MFKKRSQQKVVRRRTEIDEEEEDDNEAEQPAAATLTIKVHTNEKLNKKSKIKKQNREKPKKTSLLSFGGDEEENEEEAVVIKKSSRSRKIANKIKKMNLEDKKRPKPPPPQPKDEMPLPVPDSFDEDIAEEVTGMVEVPEVKAEQIADMGTAGIIPDASIIHKARKQREMMRKFGSEFIPTAERTTTKLKSATSSSTRSRIVREDDNDGSSDEGGTMQMRGLIRNDKNKKNMGNTVVDHEDEEVNRWEQELMKKGRFNKNGPPAPQQQHKYPTYSDYQAMFIPQEPAKVEEPKKPLEPVTITMVQNRLQSHLEALKKTNAAQKKEMENLIEDKRECEEMGIHLKDTKGLSEEYKFYQEVRQYILNLVGCLRDKLRRVQALEKSMGDLWRMQAKKMSVRRTKDMQDESAQANNMAPDKSTPEGQEYQMRVVEREARRGRRERERQKLTSRTIHQEGMSTDDEETPSDRALYLSELARVKKEQEAMFDDVVAEFGSIKAVLDKFGEWRSNFSASYYDAFIALCVPRLVIPFVRHQLVAWNPLRDSPQDWESMEWYSAISKFALAKWEGGDEMPEDVKIVSSVVERTVFARVCSLACDVWNPLSTSQTRQLDVQLRALTTGYPFMHQHNSPCQQLVMKICKSVQTCLNNDVYIPFIGAQATPQALRYFERQSWSAIKLFKNILILSDVLSFDAIKELAFDALLNRYVMLALQTSAMDVRSLAKCTLIVSCLPDNVLSHRDAAPLLKPLVGFLRCFRDSLAKCDEGGANAGGAKKMEEKLKTLLLKVDKSPA